LSAVLFMDLIGIGMARIPGRLHRSGCPAPSGEPGDHQQMAAGSRTTGRRSPASAAAPRRSSRAGQAGRPRWPAPQDEALQYRGRGIRGDV